MSDLLAKCDWDEDELRVELPQWPEVVYVWVDEKTMPYAPVVADVRSLQAENAKLQAEIAELEGTIECLKGLAEANYERCDTCEAMLDCDECLRADASHKELRGLQAEIKALRELVRDMFRDFADADCELKARHGRTFMAVTRYEPRLRELGVEL